MKLNLKRPLVVFDLEATGIDPAKDRIVEISMVKVMPDGDQLIKTRRINPGVPIPAAATAVHGISDEDVAQCNTFRQLAHSIAEFIGGCDMAGYNSNRYDVPLLVEEFLRAGVEIDLSSTKFVDVQNIFHKMEPRTLSAAHKFYCGSEVIDAHSAEADTVATYNVLLGQLERYGDELVNDIDFLSEFSTMHRVVDFAGKVTLDENDVPVFNFGKHKGKPVVQVFESEPGYYSWIMNGDFTLNTKNVITKIRLHGSNFKC